MNIEKLKASGIDYEDGLDRFSGNTMLYEKYLKKFVNLTLYDEMKQAVRKGDLKQAFECAHKLKSFVGNLSIPQLYEEIVDLTERLRQEQRMDYQVILERMDEEYERLILAVRGNDDV